MIQARPDWTCRLGARSRPAGEAECRPLRSLATWGKAGPHGAHLKIADKDEAAGSSPARPTKAASTSGNAGHCGFSASPTDGSRLGSGVEGASSRESVQRV